MKTLVAQLWDDPETIESYYGECKEVEKFWKPCMATVEAWAEENGWDYKRYTFAELEPLLPDLSSVEHIMTSKWNRACISKIGMLNNPNYDKIIVLDADIYIHGNPQLGDATFGIMTEGRWWPNEELPVLAYPQGGLYYSTCGPDVYRWCVDQFTNPSREFTYIKMNYEMREKSVNREIVNFLGEQGFGEQAVLCAYICSHEYENIENHVKLFKNKPPDVDHFIHIDGTNKVLKFEKFKSYLVYQKIDEFYDKQVSTLKTKGII